MAEVAEVRRAALALPEAQEQTRSGRTLFTVQGSVFAEVLPGGAHAVAFVDEAVVRDMVNEDPAVYTELWHGPDLVGVRIEVAVAPTRRLDQLIEFAWRRHAPRSLESVLDERRR
ncbi:hypothetical protein AB0J86_19085 [Micromonospora sp. NPDC049559]|uniref:hypothetical protein n=1 Tax=Micromonospora sp. NPDC049559 TaxID=3155923 RepID=UPI0034138065